MRRALHISEYGGPFVSPNPFVGAVIVADGRIIGEGYHRCYGEAHAEVNAVRSVSEGDRTLLRKSTMYVTLEPCSHFGKTPPCADLVIENGIPHVVVATEDPFLKNYESGIDKMRNAGVRVDVGMMRNEARRINRRFFTAHTLHRPFVLLKWARSADGFLSPEDNDGKPVRRKLSSAFTELLMHRERAFYDAIMVGVDTIIIDNPRLSCRLWPARDPGDRPVKVTFDSPRLSTDEMTCRTRGFVKKHKEESLDSFLRRLYSEFGITSLMVEGGSKTLESFLQAHLFDELRVETAPVALGSGLPAPDISDLHLVPFDSQTFSAHTITTYIPSVKNY